MSNSPLTADEIVETLKRSNIPTVLTEGRDDYFVFRFIEDDYDPLQISVMPVGGKSTLLELLSRIDELPRKPLFVVDKDLWAIFGLPEVYDKSEGVLFTTGFSIENDVFLDGDLCSLLSKAEKKKFEEDLDEICRWFCCMLERIGNSEQATLKTSPHQILSGTNRKMTDEFKNLIQYAEPDALLYKKIRDNYALLLRGKTLMRLLVRLLSSQKRRAKHSFNSLLEIGASRRGPLLLRVTDEINRYFAESLKIL